MSKKPSRNKKREGLYFWISIWAVFQIGVYRAGDIIVRLLIRRPSHTLGDTFPYKGRQGLAPLGRSGTPTVSHSHECFLGEQTVHQVSSLSLPL